MIVDIRTYHIVPRKMAQYLALFEAEALPVLRRHLGEPLGYFVTAHGALNQVVLLPLMVLLFLLNILEPQEQQLLLLMVGEPQHMK